MNETRALPESPSPTRPHAIVADEAIRTATSATFGALVLNQAGPIAVEFMSYGCAHCRVLEPGLQQAAAMVKSTEKIVRVNVAIDHELAARYDVNVTPTLVMFLDGAPVARAQGPRPHLPSLLAVLTGPFA